MKRNEFHKESIKDTKEIIRRYRKYVYEAGAVGRPDKPGSEVIAEKVLAKERKHNNFLSMSGNVLLIQYIVPFALTHNYIFEIDPI